MLIKFWKKKPKTRFLSYRTNTGVYRKQRKFYSQHPCQLGHELSPKTVLEPAVELMPDPKGGSPAPSELPNTPHTPVPALETSCGLIQLTPRAEINAAPGKWMTFC